MPAGGRVVSEKLKSVRSVSLGFWIGAGSRYEKERQGGISHFIEHLLFKGSSRYAATEIAQLFDAFGGEVNAATAREYTVVHARFLDRHLEEAFDVIADMVLNPAFAEIDSERQVVVEEIAMYEDSPAELIADYLNRAIFGQHPLGKSVLGAAAIIGSMTPDQIREYHSAHYRLPNLVIASAGNVEHERLVELARANLATGDGSPPLAVTLSPPEAPAGEAEASFHVKETQQYHVCFGGAGLSRHSPRRFALSILDTVLGGTASSRLFQEVREKRGLAYSVYSYATNFSDTGLIGVYFGCRADSVAEVTGVIAAQLRSLAETPLESDELDRAKENAKGRLVLGLETTHSRMSRLGKLTVTGSEILDIDEIIERIDAVSAADVMELAGQYYRPEKLAAVAIGPEAAVFERALERLGGRHELMLQGDEAKGSHLAPAGRTDRKIPDAGENDYHGK